MKKALFVGTFDPITLGHLSIIEKCSKLFDTLYVVIGVNPEKTPLFSLEERLQMIKEVCSTYSNVIIAYNEGLTVDFMKKNDIIYNVRGVRNDFDYEYENNMHLYNKKLYSELVTLFIPCDEESSLISSTAVREKIKNGQDVSSILPKQLLKYIKK